jgi:hypothetical protein
MTTITHPQQLWKNQDLIKSTNVTVSTFEEQAQESGCQQCEL